MATIEIPVSKDTFCWILDADWDYSTSNYATCGSSAAQRIFLEFDISEGPDEVTGVMLEVYLKGVSDGTIDFARLIEEFPDPITWNKQPDASTTDISSWDIPEGADYAWYSFDVTDLYNAAKAAGTDTLGIRWKYQNESQSTACRRWIKTKEYESGEYAPNLHVSYAATTGRVRGIVKDRDETPVAGASVNVEGVDVISGTDGYTPYVECTCGTDLRTATVTPPTGYTCWDKCTEDYFCEAGDKDLKFWLNAPIPPPTISSISWSPTGDYATLTSGAALVENKLGGGTTQLMLVATNPAAVVDPPLADGEAILQIDQEDPFIVAAGDHFRFNDKEWWALNIICGPECDIITLADEVAEAEKIPKIGDEITFAANIDWHGQEISTIRWYYAKNPGVCFDDIWDLDWKEFAVGENTNMPAHTFDTEGDEEIAFLMVTATNMDFATGTLHTLCGPIFNLWKPTPPGFMEGWLVAAFMAFILPALAEKTEYFADLVFEGDTDPDTPSGGFSLLWAPVTFVIWIAEAAAAVAEDMWDIIFGEPEEEDAGGYGLLWTAAEFVAWLYKSIAAMVEDILDLVFGN